MRESARGCGSIWTQKSVNPWDNNAKLRANLQTLHRATHRGIWPDKHAMLIKRRRAIPCDVDEFVEFLARLDVSDLVTWSEGKVVDVISCARERSEEEDVVEVDVLKTFRMFGYTADEAFEVGCLGRGDGR